MNKKEFDDQLADAVRAYNSTLPKITDRVGSMANYNERQGFRAGYLEGFQAVLDGLPARLGIAQDGEVIE